MKKALLFVLLLAVTTVLNAQPKIEYGPEIEGSNGGAYKILLLKNGNTFLFHFSKKGIEVTVYNKSHDVISQKTLESDLWNPGKIPQSNIEGLYEISGQPVIFLRQPYDGSPALFRIVLDAESGKIVKEKKLGHLEASGKPNFFTGYLNSKFGVFYVEKDPYSDCYAVAYYDEGLEDVNERIRIVHYDGSHKKISGGYYKVPDNNFKYLSFIGMTVVGDKQVDMCAYGYNSKKDKGEDARVMIAKLPAGDSVFISKVLDFSEDFRNTQAIMKYNKGTGMINLLTLTMLKAKGGTSYFLPLISYIDPATLFVTTTQIITTDKASAYMQSHLDVDAYQGLPQDMIINPDNTVTVVMEQNQQEVTTRNGSVVSAKTYLGNIGVTVLDTKGKEKEGCAILKMQVANGLMQPLYLATKGQGSWSYNGEGFFSLRSYNAYMSFDYVSTQKNRYILFNDRYDNFDRDEKRKRKLVDFPERTNTICYKLNNGDMDKFGLFGELVEGEYKFCNIESSDFLLESNTYATIATSRKGRNEETKIAWIQFE
jgi:hypothetical protein